MLLYLGSGSALVTYRREQRVHGLTDCVHGCGAAFRRFAERLESDPDGPTCGGLALGIESARDCLELCSLAASLIGRRSELAPFVFAPCAEAGRRCAEVCDALSSDDVATGCAGFCRRAEQICRQAVGQESSS